MLEFLKTQGTGEDTMSDIINLAKMLSWKERRICELEQQAKEQTLKIHTLQDACNEQRDKTATLRQECTRLETLAAKREDSIAELRKTNDGLHRMINQASTQVRETYYLLPNTKSNLRATKALESVMDILGCSFTKKVKK